MEPCGKRLSEKPQGHDDFHELGKLAANPLNSGFDGKVNLTRMHPLQGINFQERERAMWLKDLRKEEGLHLPFKMRMEERILSKHGRLPCLKSSRVLLESYLGTDETIQDYDMFSDPMAPEITGVASIMIEHSKKL